VADRKILTDIASPTWEHPADRAALNALRAIPGFDDVVRKVAAFFGEKGLRQLFLGNAVRVSETQRPKLDRLLSDVLVTLNWTERPQMYVTQSPVLNAAAVGFDKPFIVVNSAALEHLSDDELRVIIAHEVGHIMSGHVLYRTIAMIIMYVGLGGLPFLAAAVLLPFQLGLLEWYRKSELSSDRAALLAVQDQRAVMMTFLKLAGGRDYGDTIDLDDFIRQAQEYEMTGDVWDRVWQVVNTLFRDHPFNTVRAGELQRWIDSGAYQRVLGGEYTTRAEQQAKSDVAGDAAEAAGYYTDQARAAVHRLGDILGRAKDAFDDAFNGARR
jgi:Zn-dependent protease with chaperone function